MTATNPPTITEWNKASVKAAVDWVAQELAARVEADLKTNGDEWLMEKAPDALRNGRADRMKVIEAAKKGDVIAHHSLMNAFHDMLDVGEMPPASLRVYAASAKEPRGKQGPHTEHEHLLRNRILMDLVVIVCEIFDLPPTRNRAMSRAGHPCGTFIAAAAAQQLGIDVSESRLTNLWGEHGGQRGKAAVLEVRNYVRNKQGLPAI